MDNPWEQLSDCSPFVLPADEQIIEEHNKKIPKFQYQINVVPQPFIGTLSAPIYLLALNPRYCSRDIEPEQIFNLAKVKKDTLMHDVDSLPYPFYPINPAHRETSTGEWWWKRLRKLALHVGEQNLARNIFCVEYMSYHSIKYTRVTNKKSTERLLSQQYSGYLVQNAINEGKEIVFMCARKHWESLVPDLVNYPHTHKLKSRQCVYITPGNLEKESYERLVNVLLKNRPKDLTVDSIS